MDFDIEDGEILDDDLLDKEELALAEPHLNSITSTPENLDKTLMTRQAKFEACLSKFLESARRDAGVSSDDGTRNVNISKTRHQKTKAKIKNGSGCNFKKVKTKFRLRKAKTWINANQGNFGGEGSSWSAWRKASKPTQQPDKIIRSPDDLRNKLNAMRNARQEHSSPNSRFIHSDECGEVQDVEVTNGVNGGRSNEQEAMPEDEDMQDDNQSPQIEQNSIAEEIAHTDSEIELLINEARVLNARNEAARNVNKILSEQANIREYRRSCARLESAAKSLRADLAKLKKNLAEETHQATTQTNRIHDAKDILLQRKSQYMALRKECDAMRRVIVDPTYRPPKPSPSRLARGREEFHWTSGSSAAASEKANERRNVRPTTTTKDKDRILPAMSNGNCDSVESLRLQPDKPDLHLKGNLGENREKLADSLPPASQTETKEVKSEVALPLPLGFTDILKTGTDAGSPWPKLARYEKYQSCLFGSLI